MIKNFKSVLKKEFFENLEKSSGKPYGQLRIEIILNRGSVKEKMWFDFKRIRYTKRRMRKM